MTEISAGILALVWLVLAVAIAVGLTTGPKNRFAPTLRVITNVYMFAD